MLTRLIVVIMSQHTQITNHVVHLKLIQCYIINYTSIEKKKKKAILRAHLEMPGGGCFNAILLNEEHLVSPAWSSSGVSALLV